MDKNSKIYKITKWKKNCTKNANQQVNLEMLKIKNIFKSE